MSARWPPCEQANMAVYGIDDETCKAAEELWKTHSRRYALHQLGDEALGLDLMLKAATDVTRRRRARPDQPIEHLKTYLRVSFERLVVKELVIRQRFDPIAEGSSPPPGDDRKGSHTEGAVVSTDATQVRETELNQIKRVMWEIDPLFLRVSEALWMGHSYKEIAPHVGMKEGALRAWYSRQFKKLKQHINPDAP